MVIQVSPERRNSVRETAEIFRYARVIEWYLSDPHVFHRPFGEIHL